MNHDSAHHRLLEEARQALLLREVEKKLLVVPPADAASRHSAAAPKAIRLGAKGDAASVSRKETDARLRLLAREIWEREICFQYARIELLHHIIKPQVDALILEERNQRAEIREAALMSFHTIIGIEAPAKLFGSAKHEASKRKSRHDVRSAGAVKSSSDDVDPSRMGADGRPSTAAERRGTETAAALVDEAENILERICRDREARIGAEAAAASPLLDGHHRTPAPPVSSEDRRAQGLADRVVLRPRPPPRSQSFVHERTMVAQLDLATTVHLQNQLTYFRRLIEESERETRSDIEGQHASGRAAVAALVHRRQHMERLVYWRTERDARRRAEELLMFLQECLRTTVSDEAVAREQISREEDDDSARLWTDEYADYCAVELLDLSSDELLERHRVVLDCNTTAALSLIPFSETLRRHVMEAECNAAYDSGAILTAHGNLVELQHFAMRVRSECIKIQRFVRGCLRGGPPGWRRTHREVGEFVKWHRDRLRHAAQKAQLHSLQHSLAAQMTDVWSDIEAELRQVRRALEIDESNARVEIQTHQEWFRAGMQRQFQNEWIHGIIMPKFAALCEVERCKRDTLEIFDEAPDRERLAEWHQVNTRLIHSKAIQVKNEGLDRLHIVDDEGDAFQEVCAEAHRNQAGIRERQRLHDEAQARARGELWDEAVRSAAVSVTDAFQRSMAALNDLFKVELLVTFATSPRLSGRGRLFAEWAYGHVELCTQFLEWSHAFFGRGLIASSRESILATLYPQHREACAVQEKSELFAAFVASTYAEIVSEFTVQQQAIEVAVEARHRAARVIQTFFRRYLLGAVGRTGMGNYLRVVYQDKRARAEIRRKMREQRNDIATAKRELEQEIASYNLDSDRAYEELLSHVVTKSEPRQRAAIASQEQFLVDIVKRNFDYARLDILKELLAETLQRESYFRTDIFLQWKRDHESKILSRQLVFQEDVKIRPAQRAWRCFLARKERRHRADTLILRLPTIEQRERWLLSLDEAREFAFDLVKPIISFFTFDDQYFSHVMLQGTKDACIAQRSILFELEWRERCAVLWAYQQALRYRVIEDGEAKERRKLVSATLDAGRRRAELFEDESVARKAIEQERLYFLLRVVVGIEQVHRCSLGADLYSSTLTTVECAAEPFERARIETSCFHALKWPLIHYESNQRIRILIDEEDLRVRMELLASESAKRIDCEDRRNSLTLWYLWLVDVQESRQRCALEQEAQLLRRLIVLARQEYGERHAIVKMWISKMAHPSTFSPRGVVSVSPPFTYLCELQEEEVRRLCLTSENSEFWREMYEMKEMTFRSYLNLRLV